VTLLSADRTWTVIRPTRGWVALQVSELWRYRELVYFLIWRDVKVRYRQTALGVAWAVLQPLLSMVVFSLFFGRLAGLQSEGLPYPVFNLAGLVPWTFFVVGISEAATSLVGSRNLITKVYFPRLAVPLAVVLAGLVDFAIALVLLLAVMTWYGIVPGVHAVLVLPLVLVAFAASLGAGLWLAALNVEYRDVRYVVPFLTQLWMFATPVVYSSSIVPGRLRTLYGLNPMVGVVDGFRSALLGTSAPGAGIAVSALTAVVLAASGALYFRRMERTFADTV
jgi:homopolymeric O-antigen transport system permease protein